MKLAIVCATAFTVTAGLLAAASAPSLPADTYQVDSVHSSMVFRIKHMGVANFYGRFNAISGNFTLDNDPSKCAFEIEIQTESVDTANTKRDQHLKGPDFFNAKQFPKITFKSKQCKKSGDSMEVAGDLTLHGVTKPATAKVTKTGSGNIRGKQTVGVEAELKVKRSEFDMNFALDTLGDDIMVIISLEGAR